MYTSLAWVFDLVRSCWATLVEEPHPASTASTTYARATEDIATVVDELTPYELFSYPAMGTSPRKLEHLAAPLAPKEVPKGTAAFVRLFDLTKPLLTDMQPGLSHAYESIREALLVAILATSPSPPPPAPAPAATEAGPAAVPTPQAQHSLCSICSELVEREDCQCVQCEQIVCLHHWRPGAAFGDEIADFGMCRDCYDGVITLDEDDELSA